MLVPWRSHLGSWLVRGLAFVAALAVVGSMSVVPARASDFASVTITFTNTGSLPLHKRFHNLDHGCWQTEPPLTIPALSTVTWQSVSCGVFTGTEGSVLYQPYGAPDGINGRFYWDDPVNGDNTAQNSAPSGCSSSQTNPPPDGLTFEIFFTMGCNASSGDGIADVWKLNKAAFDPGGGIGKQIVDLAAMGAAVGQKDIFIQLDWMQDATHNQQLDPAAVTQLVTAYAANGYSLHVDAGPNSTLNYGTNATWGSLSRARSTGYQAGLGTGTVDAAGNATYNWTAFNAIKAASFLPTGRGQIFHYALAASQLGNMGNSGISSPRGTGNDIIISLGAFTGGVGSVDEQTGTLMHELGHNLGLDHGGGDSVNFKPNYFSVMNYAFSLRGIVKNGKRIFDYSHGGQRDLVESGPYGLDEGAGVGPNATGFQTQHFCPAKGTKPAARIPVANAAGRIDWNCDGVPDTSSVNADINADPKQPMNTLGTLVDYDDWSHLKLTAGAIGSFGAPVPEAPIESRLDDPTPEMMREILPLDTTAPVTSAQASPAANQAGWSNGDVTVTISASDDISGVARTEHNLDDGGWTLYSTPLVISTDAVHTLQYRSIDRSSNVETAKSLTVKLDKTPPTVSYTGNAGTYGILDTVSITCTPADNLSGVASSTCQNINGPAYDLSLGSTTLSATATDVAGNTGQGSTSFTLTVTFDDMCTLSKRFVTNLGSALSAAMCVQLDAAELAQAQGNQAAKAAAISAYLTTVDTAVIGGFMSPSNAAILKKLSVGL
jgi:hypothetical protein